MAQIEIDYLDYLVTAPDALDNSFIINRTLAPKNQEHSLVIEVVAGSIQFCLGQVVQANSPIHATGAKIVFTIYGGRVPVFYKASAGSDQFIVGY
jgi:hypothetical protein